MKVLALAFALALGACSSLNSSARSGTEYTCAAATAALKTAIEFNAKLTPAQRASVTAATRVLDPVCSQPMVPAVSSTVQAGLTGALSTLTTIATAVAPK